MWLLRANSQTFMIGAIDPRIAAAFPCVMVSTAMQGGCTCENTSCLRLGTGNVEIAACLAPRPLGLTAANDWTHEIETVGLPELKQHYAMLGVPDRVQGNKLEFGHNYNARSRALMYGFFNKVTATTAAALALFRLAAVRVCCAQHFELGFGPEQLVEQDYIPLSLAEATVWAVTITYLSLNLVVIVVRVLRCRWTGGVRGEPSDPQRGDGAQGAARTR